MNDSDFDALISIVTKRTGIIPRESHKMGIRNYIEKKLENLKISFSEYCNLIMTDASEFSELVNESTVNETYFFREEKQFIFLKNRIFEEWKIKNSDRPIKIWSAACSYGEEAYSIALLAESCHLKAEISASDINSKALDVCKKGKLRHGAKRMGDGEMFHHLFERYAQEDGYFKMPPSIVSMVKTMNLNLLELEKSPFVPKKQNVIFIRNVFIYFSRDVRKKILEDIAENCLDNGGYLFVSMSEIAQIDSEITPKCLEKIYEGNVFCFHKK